MKSPCNERRLAGTELCGDGGEELETEVCDIIIIWYLTKKKKNANLILLLAFHSWMKREEKTKKSNPEKIFFFFKFWLQKKEVESTKRNGEKCRKCRFFANWQKTIVTIVTQGTRKEMERERERERERRSCNFWWWEGERAGGRKRNRTIERIERENGMELWKSGASYEVSEKWREKEGTRQTKRTLPFYP